MAYATGNPKSKAELKRWLADGQQVRVFQPGPFSDRGFFDDTNGPINGDVSIEGPHYPQPHRWYARVKVEDGRIVKVIS